MDIISTHNLIKDYDNGEITTKVLKGINFSVRAGEFVSIMGPSGSGKSTLLYQLGLIDDPTAGEVRLEGKVVSDLSSKEKQKIRLHELGFIFQDYALVPELTATENVIVPLLMKGMNKSEAIKIAHEHLEIVGLRHRVNNLPSQMSGGEQQRVSVARAVAHDPKILFADEPTASLDSEMSHQLMEALMKLHKEEGQTIVLVTHELEYGKMAERIVHLKDGQITTR